MTGWNKGIVIATSSGRIVGLTVPMDANSTATKLIKLRLGYVSNFIFEF